MIAGQRLLIFGACTYEDHMLSVRGLAWVALLTAVGQLHKSFVRLSGLAFVPTLQLLDDGEHGKYFFH
jgi:hypothetical protein